MGFPRGKTWRLAKKLLKLSLLRPVTGSLDLRVKRYEATSDLTRIIDRALELAVLRSIKKCLKNYEKNTEQSWGSYPYRSNPREIIKAAALRDVVKELRRTYYINIDRNSVIEIAKREGYKAEKIDVKGHGKITLLIKSQE